MTRIFLSQAISFFSVLVVGLLLAIPFSVKAQNLGGSYVKNAAENAGFNKDTTETTFAETIGTVIQAILSFVGVIFLVLMVYAGFLWMTARGDEGQVEKAQDIITTSIIGLVIVIGAYSITAFVVPKILERTAGGG